MSDEIVKTDQSSLPPPSYSIFQLVWMLLVAVVQPLWNLLFKVGGGTGGWFFFLWEKLRAGVKDSLFISILLAAVAGFAGGKASEVELPSFNNLWTWIFEHLPHPTPTPPGPGPEPTPTPVPPAPIPAQGLHVLVVGDEAKLTPQQINALKSVEVRTYLNSTCPKGPDGKTAEYRIWPSTIDTTNESQLWKDAFQRTVGKPFPWIVVSNPQHGGGFEGVLPADQASLLVLLKKFGG